MLTQRWIEIHGPTALRRWIASSTAGLLSIPERLRASEYLQVGQSRRFRAVQRRRTRSASRVGLLLIAAANAFDAIALSGLQPESGHTSVALALDLAMIALALSGWWTIARSLRHHPEVVAWFISFGLAASTVVTGISVPSLAVQSIGYLLVLPGLIVLVLPWRTQVHVRWLLAVATLDVGAFMLDPGGRFSGGERGDLVVVLFVALGASLAGHILLQRAQIRNFAQLERIRVLRRRADASVFELEQAHHDLELTARIDPLTGANNRRRLEEDLRAVRAHIDRSGMTYGLLMLDLDRFKAINDRRGHIAGDDVLRRVTAAICGSLRADDAVYRYGGEEFVAILAVPTADRLLRAAERLRTVVLGLAIEHPENLPCGLVSVSVGATLIGRFNLDLTTDQWLGQSDAALYAAKEGGRNQVRLATDHVLPPDGSVPARDFGSPNHFRRPPSLNETVGAPRRRSTD